MLEGAQSFQQVCTLKKYLFASEWIIRQVLLMKLIYLKRAMIVFAR